MKVKIQRLVRQSLRSEELKTKAGRLGRVIITEWKECLHTFCKAKRRESGIYRGAKNNRRLLRSRKWLPTSAERRVGLLNLAIPLRGREWDLKLWPTIAERREWFLTSSRVRQLDFLKGVEVKIQDAFQRLQRARVTSRGVLVGKPQKDKNTTGEEVPAELSGSNAIFWEKQQNKDILGVRKARPEAHAHCNDCFW